MKWPWGRSIQAFEEVDEETRRTIILRMQPLLYFLAFPVFLYLLIGANFAIVLCFFAPRFLTPENRPPPWLRRLAALPAVLFTWPRYARRMVRSDESGGERGE